LGIDYADALTGFEFRGRHGTAVLKGIVVAVEYRDAVEAVIEGFRDEQARVEERMRSVEALRMWRHLLMSLRIKKRVDAYEVDGEEPDFVPSDDDDEGMQSEEYFDDGAGGFFPE
jgi:xeroderma pigmentosum group C-complementing protein